MSKKKLNFAVIGAGRIGQVHAENLVTRFPEVKLSGISDPNLSAAQACARKLGIENAFEDYQPFLDNPEVDAVLICSPTDTHARIIEDAAKAGKHIFCEKPIALSLGRIDQALAAVEKAGVKMQIGFNRRFDPNFEAVREAILKGQIGTPHLLHIVSRDPQPPHLEFISGSGGLFLDMTIHDFDMARFLIDSEIESVYALGGVRIDPAIGEAGDIDTCVVTFQFANGVIGTIDNSREAVYGYDQRVEVFGSGGVIQTENLTPNRTVYGNREGFHTPLPLRFFMERYELAYVRELQAFVRCLLEDTPSPVSGKDGREPIVVALAAQRSLKEKRPVPLKEIEAPALV